MHHVPKGRSNRDSARVVALQENASMRGHRVEHDRTVRRDDDLQVVAQGELLQLQHEQLLHPGVQPGLHLVDQDQRAVELEISCAR